MDAEFDDVEFLLQSSQDDSKKRSSSQGTRITETGLLVTPEQKTDLESISTKTFHCLGWYHGN